MRFSFFDLHCDTATELFRHKETLKHNSLAISLDRAERFDRYAQIMAFWTEPRSDNESGWERLSEVLNYLKSDGAVQAQKAKIATDATSVDVGTFLFLSVEDARILNHKTKRIYELYDMGFRFITPLWAGETCIGGSHDTDAGLTAFGKEVLQEAAAMGMILDISHASQKSADDLFEIAAKQNRPVIASHSNAHEICGVLRNLHPQQIRDILSLDGLIGLNLYRRFLSERDEPSREDVLRHIEYFLEQGCENILCFGCDMDGAELPKDLQDISAIPSLREYLSSYYSEKILNQIFFQNAYHFVERNLNSSAKNL